MGIKTKETIQGHPLDPKQAIEVFTTKSVGNFRYLTTVPWKRRDLERLDRLWRQGYKTTWKLNKNTVNHPWTIMTCHILPFGVDQNPRYRTDSDSGVMYRDSFLYVTVTGSDLSDVIPSTVISFVFDVLT